MYTGAGVVQARPGREAIEAQLARILAGNEFRRSERRRALLRWTVNRALDGNEDPIKEYEIGLAVFGKPKSWDPRLDPIVRVEFSRMRQKLREYYAGQGAADPILIEFPFRGYLPVFHAREAAAEQAAGEPAPATTEPSLWRSRGTIALALVLALLSGAGIFLASSRLRTAPPLPTVAVLPFKDLTPRGQSQYLSNGISEELTDLLAMAPDLRVIARTSAFHFQGKNTDVREIGRELGAGWVIEGSILSEGDRIRVLVELDRTADGARLWKSRYERAAKDLPGIEEEITQAVAGVLQVPLPPRREVAFDPGLDARDEFLKGVDAESKADPASLDLAEAHYQNALRLAPRYALAHVRLGSVYLARSGRTGPSQKAALEKARQELDAAVSLDPKLSGANAGLALANYLLTWDWPSAEAGFRRALALGSSSAAHQTYAWALMTRGRFAESERHYQEAIERDPLDCLLRYNLATLYSREGRAAAARGELESCLAREPDWFLGRMALGYFELFDNRPDQGLKDLRQARLMAPGSPALDAGFAIADAELGRRGEALARLRRMESEADTRNYVRYQLAIAWAYLKDRDRLFYWLGQSVDLHEQQALNMRIDPVLEPYQQDARMISLERRTGLLP